MKKTKFPLEHVVNHDTKEVWVICDSAITAMGIPAMVKEFYPGYTGKIASREYFETLKMLYFFWMKLTLRPTKSCVSNRS
jgi:hypothetical protein